MRTGRRWGRLVPYLALSLSVLSSNAAASEEYVESEARMAARVLAAQGSEAFEQRDFARALELFQRAGAIIPAPTITLMEARTLVELGRLVEGAEKYVTTQRMLSVDPTNAVFRDAADIAQRELQVLLQRIPTMRVVLTGMSANERPDVQIDGRRVLPALASVDRPSNPGPHRVEVRFSTGVVVREVTLVERQHEDIEIKQPPPAPAKAPAPVVAAPTQVPAESSSFNTLGWAVTGAGAVFTGVGVVTGILALNHKAELDDVCKPSCPPEYASDIDAFRLERTLSYVGFGLGIAGLAGGTYLLLRPQPQSNVALNISPYSVAVSGRFQ